MLIEANLISENHSAMFLWQQCTELISDKYFFSEE